MDFSSENVDMEFVYVCDMNGEVIFCGGVFNML